jgi:hypothetical protein
MAGSAWQVSLTQAVATIPASRRRHSHANNLANNCWLVLNFLPSVLLPWISSHASHTSSCFSHFKCLSRTCSSTVLTPWLTLALHPPQHVVSAVRLLLSRHFSSNISFTLHCHSLAYCGCHERAAYIPRIMAYHTANHLHVSLFSPFHSLAAETSLEPCFDHTVETASRVQAERR